MLAVLLRHMSQEKAESAIVALREGFADWNEMRVAQVQEIAGLMLRKGKRPSRHSIRNVIAAARDARDYLQEVFQRFEPTHRDLARVTTQVATRRQNLRRLISSVSRAGSQLLFLANGAQDHGGLSACSTASASSRARGRSRNWRGDRAASSPTGRRSSSPCASARSPTAGATRGSPVPSACSSRSASFGRKVAHDWRVQQTRPRGDARARGSAPARAREEGSRAPGPRGGARARRRKRTRSASNARRRSRVSTKSARPRRSARRRSSWPRRRSRPTRRRRVAARQGEGRRREEGQGREGEEAEGQALRPCRLEDPSPRHRRGARAPRRGRSRIRGPPDGRPETSRRESSPSRRRSCSPIARRRAARGSGGLRPRRRHDRRSARSSSSLPPKDARRMLAVLSDSRHKVVTGVCALRVADGAPRAASSARS